MNEKLPILKDKNDVNWITCTGHVDVVKFLAKNGAEINRKSESSAYEAPLILAIMMGVCVFFFNQKLEKIL